MIWFIVFGVLCMVGTGFFTSYLYFSSSTGDFMDIIMGVIVGIILSAVIMFIVGATIVPMTTGVFKNYAVGQRDGYLTTVYIEGVIWKTNEAQMQVGTGELAALQEPFNFSIDNEELLIELKKAIGKKIRVNFLQWGILPYRKGGTSYLLTGFTVLN